MSKIFTLTLNPAVDHNIIVESFKTGEVMRSIQSTVTAAGKGINVARTLTCLRNSAEAFCLVGKQEAHHYKSLRTSRFKLQMVPVEGATRSNITIADSRGKLAAHLQTQGFRVREEQLQKITRDLENQAGEGDVLVISGSTPDGVPAGYYEQLIRNCSKKGYRVIFDSSGSHYKNGLEGIPDVIKPNIEELKELSGSDIRTVADIIREAKMLNYKGIGMVFISRGKKGVLLSVKDQPGYWTASVTPGAGTREGNEIGCGDAMIAGIALSLLHSYETEDLLRMAVACGAANLLSKGPGVVAPDDVQNLFSQAVVKYHRGSPA